MEILTLYEIGQEDFEFIAKNNRYQIIAQNFQQKAPVPINKRPEQKKEGEDNDKPKEKSQEDSNNNATNENNAGSKDSSQPKKKKKKKKKQTYAELDPMLNNNLEKERE